MNALERRYRRLLNAYPADYRAARGEEIIATLLEAAPPDQVRPRPREAAALVLGGLRVRAAQNQRLSTPANLRLAVILGLAIFVGFFAAGRAAVVTSSALSNFGYSERVLGSSGYLVFSGVLSLTAIALIWLAPRYLAVPALGLAAVVLLHPLRAPGVELAALLVLLAVLAALSPQRPPRSWLWWLAALPAWAVLAAFGNVYPPLAAVATTVPVPLIFVVAALLWTVVDGRIALAYAAAVALYGVLSRGVLVVPLSWILLAIIAALALPALLRIRRQAVL